MLPRTFHELTIRELGAGLRARRFTSLELTRACSPASSAWATATMPSSR
ncbi:MAG: hypothetical protein ABIP29_10845 [Candidatus Eisenbacteria bacterium]